jgi:uncharacterized protein (TIGR00369 family)
VDGSETDGTFAHAVRSRKGENGARLAASAPRRQSGAMATTQTFVPQDVDFERRVRDSFMRQAVMSTLGAKLERVAPGEVDIALPYRADLGQQHGFLHAGILATVLDSACGYAAFSLMPAGAAVLSIEFKINMLSPAAGERFVARARVVRAGRTIIVSHADGFSITPDGEKLVAVMTGTMMCVRDNPDLSG